MIVEALSGNGGGTRARYGGKVRSEREAFTLRYGFGE